MRTRPEEETVLKGQLRAVLQVQWLEARQEQRKDRWSQLSEEMDLVEACDLYQLWSAFLDASG